MILHVAVRVLTLKEKKKCKYDSMTPLLKIHHPLDEVPIFTVAYHVLYNLAPTSVSRFISHQILFKKTPGLSSL